MPVSSVSFDPSVTDQLACPACYCSLVLGKQSLLCQSCGRAYPIVDGIPVLIIERSVLPTD